MFEISKRGDRHHKCAMFFARLEFSFEEGAVRIKIMNEGVPVFYYILKYFN